jgi:hypothetical protein
VIQRRTNRAPVSMGSFVPMLGTGYAAPGTRWCPRCGARLSRYALQSETMCAPCQAHLHPWVIPEPRPMPPTVCPECGGYKQPASKKCRRCREGDPTSGPRRTCICGRLARRGRRTCSRCDRERRAVASDHTFVQGTYGTGKMKASGIAPAGLRATSHREATR